MIQYTLHTCLIKVLSFSLRYDTSLIFHFCYCSGSITLQLKELISCCCCCGKFGMQVQADVRHSEEKGRKGKENRGDSNVLYDRHVCVCVYSRED